jgi:hypothetical protein
LVVDAAGLEVEKELAPAGAGRGLAEDGDRREAEAVVQEDAGFQAFNLELGPPRRTGDGDAQDAFSWVWE